MKQAELRKHATCSLCRKGIGHAGLPLFYRVTVERFGVDLAAVRRQHGLGALLGGSPEGHAIAAVMGPDADMAIPVMEPAVLTVCETCSTIDSMPVAMLAEIKP